MSVKLGSILNEMEEEGYPAKLFYALFRQLEPNRPKRELMAIATKTARIFQMMDVNLRKVYLTKIIRKYITKVRNPDPEVGSVVDVILSELVRSVLRRGG